MKFLTKINLRYLITLTVLSIITTGIGYLVLQKNFEKRNVGGYL